ncbi:MAG: phospho-N-acetylmuramoyl-pentapeptide-transferase [Actinobacteria bacterium]|nr:phospho-N-acetylmuramoyl-pentapeptide-transferase [Actinomycetota bacterium]
MIAILLAGGMSLAFSLVGTRYLIDWLSRHGIGQPIHEDVPEGHKVKAGKPTMGGIAIVVAAVAGYVFAHVRRGMTFSRSGILVMGLIAGAAVVGGIDDWIKVTNERNLGLSKRAKTLGLLTVAIGFAGLAVQYTPVKTTLSFTRFDLPGLQLGRLVWLIWAVVLISACTNAVNITDGLDGLGAGSSIFGFAAYTVISFWMFRNNGVVVPGGTFANYQVPHALDLAVVSAAMLGGTAGFLWWNAAPARIIMGDTGSLALGAGLAGLALLTNTQMLLPIIGGLFVFETLSVILQVFAFRVFHRRVFRMAPIHHHYELAGWPETTIIIRFWILAGLSTAVALGVFLADYIQFTNQ